jgi:Zn-dependent M28 family amino/carboxypeptidase
MLIKKENLLKQRAVSVALFLLLAAILTAQTRNNVKTPAAAPKSNLVNAARILQDVETLAADEMRGRGAGSPEIVKAREYVEKRFKESGLKPVGNSFLQEFALKTRNNSEAQKGANVVGIIKGRKTPEKYIIITAHYDHVGVEKGEIYNGADDNASGTAALFALAEYFNKNRPRHSMIFVAFDAEEIGLQGARHFVANLPVKKEAILLNINMDMISRSDAGELYAAGAFHYPFLKPHLERAAKNAPVKLLLGHDRPELGSDDWTNQSDHAAFHQAKIPFIYFGVEDHKDYHKPTDDFTNINQQFYIHAVETILEAMKIFDKNLK